MQEMFLEIEQKLASLSSPSQQDELGALGSQQEAAKLFSRLERLKVNLVSFQQLLQDRQGEERTATPDEPREQVECEQRSGDGGGGSTRNLPINQSKVPIPKGIV